MSDSPVTYPDRIEIVPLSRPPAATVRVPGSKSITNRALVLGALSAGSMPCELRGALRSEDTEVMIGGLRTLGYRIDVDWPQDLVRVDREEGRLVPRDHADLFVA